MVCPHCMKSHSVMNPCIESLRFEKRHFPQSFEVARTMWPDACEHVDTLDRIQDRSESVVPPDSKDPKFIEWSDQWLKDVALRPAWLYRTAARIGWDAALRCYRLKEK